MIRDRVLEKARGCQLFETLYQPTFVRISLI